ncbi:MAG: aminoacetone oxidase family FAD-binding enzyme, partial [Rikenellaceae bacterium]
SHEEFLAKVRAGAEFVRSSFELFDNMETIRFFERIGVPISIEQGGRAYPRSGDAWDIALSLERWAIKHGAKIVCGCEVKNLIVKNGMCTGVVTNGKEYFAPKVVITTGGVSYSGTGSTGDGYRMAYEVGHTVVPVAPSLVPFEIGGRFIPSLAGLILKNVMLTLCVDGVERAKELGEVEFFRFGIGGGVVFRLSRDAVEAFMDGHKVEFLLDLKPSLSMAKLLGRVAREVEAKPTLRIDELLLKLMPSKMAAVVSSISKVDGRTAVASTSERAITELLTLLKNFHLPVIAHRGFKEAVVTAGGISTTEIDPLTMESKLIRGLFFAGEVIDIDADTGGYNLQLAFSTAYCVAK